MLDLRCTTSLLQWIVTEPAILYNLADLDRTEFQMHGYLVSWSHTPPLQSPVAGAIRHIFICHEIIV